MEERKQNLKTVALSLLVMALWGSLFPFVKIGYGAFGITANSVPDILMFAGARFTSCGAAVSLFCLLHKEKIATPRGKNIFWIVMMGMFAIVLHYTCTYIGLSTTDSSKTALIKQLGALLYVCFSFLFIRSEKFSILKIVGALVGFSGIVAINVGSGGIHFSLGDILIIGASACTVISNIITKLRTSANSPYWITGLSQLVGGVFLLGVAIALGAHPLVFTLRSTAVFLYICIVSIVSYTLWYYILSTNALSKMFIIKFAEPLFACLFGAILLGENIFKLQYLAAFVLISLGIVLGNLQVEKAKKT